MRWQPDEDAVLINAARGGGTFVEIAEEVSRALNIDVTDDMARNRLRRLGVVMERPEPQPVIDHDCWLCRVLTHLLAWHYSDKPVFRREDTRDTDYWLSRGALKQLNRRVDAALREEA